MFYKNLEMKIVWLIDWLKLIACYFNLQFLQSYIGRQVREITQLVHG